MNEFLASCVEVGVTGRFIVHEVMERARGVRYGLDSMSRSYLESVANGPKKLSAS